MTAVISLATLAFLRPGGARAPAEQLAGARGRLGSSCIAAHRHRARVVRGLSLTAGACKLFFRGLAPWLLSSWMPAWAAMASATALFGLAHAYQGLAGIPRTAIIGAALALLTLWAGTLWPAILLHTVIDLHGGSVGGSIARAPAAAQT
ncbi:MAG: CPBP family intramembrane glutamic endopeptidase [Nannocystaceae bacterium]